MSSRPPHAKLRSLIDRLHDGPPLSKQEVAQLEEYLEDDEALAYYIAVSQQEALLPSAIPEHVPAEEPSRIVGFPNMIRLVVPLAAACVVFALGVSLGRRMDHGASASNSTVVIAPTHAAPARITGMVGVEWADESASHEIDLDSSSAPISIKSGLVEVTYGNGVCVTLEGPAVYEVAGHEEGRLAKGKLYTTVPKGAEGFKIHYSGGTVEDLGTEFAMDAQADGSTEVGVFSGKVKLHSAGRDSIMLFENQSLLQSPGAEEPFEPVPLDREKFVDKLPARDFRWEVNSPGTREFTCDVTHLVWKPAKYRAIFKWISGMDAVNLRDVQLFRDGEVVASDDHAGSTGVLRYVSNNIYALDIPPGEYARGRWTITAKIETISREGGNLANADVPIGSRGILQFEEGLVTGAGPEQFIGRWTYRHMGTSFVREFHPDGSVSLEQDGVKDEGYWVDSRWEVKDGVLNLSIPKRGLVERHVLRDPKTLIFASNPYENAVKESD